MAVTTTGRNGRSSWLPNRFYVSAGILAAAAIFIAVLQLNLHGAAVCGYSWLQLPLLSARSSQAATDNGATLAPTGLAPGCLLAFADIHGDLQQALRVLQLVGAIDQDGKWAAGSCTLVQTGDLVDRGPQSLTVLRLFERLKEEAVQAGGQLITLMGNHEMESIQGDFKDISNEELASMGRAALAHNSTDELLEAVPVFYRRMIHTYFDGTPEEVAGVATWAASLKPGSWLGDTIRSRKVATVLGNGSCRTLFVHAGLDMTTLTDLESLAKERHLETDVLSTLNTIVAEELHKCDGTGPCPSRTSDARIQRLFGSHGPWWMRIYHKWAQRCSSSGSEASLQAILDKTGARQVVVGHTIQWSPKEACNGKLYMMDVGMCKLILGNLAAWKCVDGNASIVQPQEVL